MVQFEGGANELHAYPLQEAPKGCQQFAIAGKLTRLQYQALMEGLEKIKVSNDKAEELGKALASKKEVLGKADAANRQLVPRDSDVTMGSEHTIPDMLKPPVPKGEKG